MRESVERSRFGKSRRRNKVENILYIYIYICDDVIVFILFRWYLQLPTAQAHEFHACDVESLAFTAGLEECVEHLSPDRQLDPRLKKRVHELVRTGTTGRKYDSVNIFLDI